MGAWAEGEGAIEQWKGIKDTRSLVEGRTTLMRELRVMYILARPEMVGVQAFPPQPVPPSGSARPIAYDELA